MSKQQLAADIRNLKRKLARRRAKLDALEEVCAYAFPNVPSTGVEAHLTDVILAMEMDIAKLKRRYARM